MRAQPVEGRGRVMRVLSLGAGVQSTTVLLLSAEGRLPRLDAAVFADTQAEPQYVYDHLERLRVEVAEPAGIDLQVVSDGDLWERSLDRSYGYPSIPVFVRNRDGKRGKLPRRICTKDYKITPLKRATRLLLGAKVDGKGRVGQPPRGCQAEQWIGISVDEFERMRDSDVRYQRSHFPLVEVMDWSRRDCIAYLREKEWGSTPRSACVFCPFKSNGEWRWLRDGHPEEWGRAVEFDHLLREAPYKVLQREGYLHGSLLPLEEAPIDKWGRKDRQDAQLDFEGISCSPFACAAGERI